MRIRALLATLCLVAAGAALPGAGADAAVVTPVPGLTAAGNGIALGADGNLWVAEESAGTVARLSPTGTVVGRYAVGNAPTGVAAGPGGKIWVAVTGSDRLAIFDTSLANPTPIFVTTPSTCGPVAVVDGGNNRMYVSMPLQNCSDVPKVSWIAASGLGGFTTAQSPGEAFDLEVAAGKLFVPDFTNDVVRRLDLTTLAVDATYTAPGGAGIDGIATDGAGKIWVTAFNTGALLTVPVTAASGTAMTAVPLPGGTLTNPFGLVLGPTGRMYASGAGSANLVRVGTDGSGVTFVPTPAGSEPWQLAQGPGGDLFATDISAARVLRVIDAAPTVAATSARATTATTADVAATVDARGNATQVVVDYGTTTAYGATTTATTVAAGAVAAPSSRQLTGLQPGTTYHVRVRATNVLGTTTGPDLVVTTPAAPVAPRTGKTNLGATKLRSGSTRITGLKAVGVRPGDKVSVSCRGKGCQPRATTKPVRVKKAGSFSLKKAVQGLVLAPGAKLTVRLRFTDGTGAVVVYTMVRGKFPTSRQR